MTLRALTGIFALNALLLVSGASLLWLARGWRTWLEFARLAGLAYVVGVAASGSVWTLLLVVGVPFSGWIVLATPFVFLGAALAIGSRLRRSRPVLGSVTVTRGTVVAAIGIAAAGVFLEALFRASRLGGLYNWDAWAFWVPKAKAIYLFGRLDEYFFTALPGAAYPPLVPSLDAAAFHAMGSADVTTLHTQFWFLGVGFVWAFAGVLSERVPAWILWPFVLVLLVAPRIGPRFAVPEADMVLGFFFVVAAALLCLWLLDGERWRLVVAAVLLCGLVLTKREGILLAAVLAAATLLAGAREWRRVWPAIGIAAVAVAAAGVPWRLWYVQHGVTGEGPTAGFNPTSNTERAWPALRLALDVLFSSEYWNVIVAVALGALALAAFARLTRLVVFFGSALALITLGGGWITWAIPDLPITQELGANPIVRYMGAAALLSAAAAPVLLGEAWSAASAAVRREESR
jgi:hypothetical protein